MAWKEREEGRGVRFCCLVDRLCIWERERERESTRDYTNQFNGLSPQLPLIPLVGLDDVGLHEVGVCLCAHVTFGYGWAE